MEHNLPYLQGSIWRKWDLHIHTPSSYDWDKSCKDSAEDIVEKAISENISVIAITDHHTVNGIAVKSHIILIHNSQIKLPYFSHSVNEVR